MYFLNINNKELNIKDFAKFDNMGKVYMGKNVLTLYGFNKNVDIKLISCGIFKYSING